MSCCAQSLSHVYFQPHGLQPTRLLCPWGFSRQEYWRGLPCPPPGHLPDPGIKPRSPTLQADSIPSDLPGKPKNTRVGSLSLLQGIFLTQESNQTRIFQQHRRLGFEPLVGKIPRKGMATHSIFLLENSTDRGFWWAVVARSQTQLSSKHFHFHGLFMLLYDKN